MPPLSLKLPKLKFLQMLACNEGWGAHFGSTTTQGSWSRAETLLHINIKEMLAVYFGLKSLVTCCEGRQYSVEH